MSAMRHVIEMKEFYIEVEETMLTYTVVQCPEKDY